VTKNHTKTLHNLVIYRLNIIETDFGLGKTTLSENLPLSSVQSNRAVFFMDQSWLPIAAKSTPYTGAHALSGLGRTLG
jgi:hypothetical protein